MKHEIDYSEIGINQGEEAVQMARLRALWVAVLASAVTDYYGGPSSRPPANRWLQSKHHDVGSFEFVCSILDLDPGEARLKILAAEGRISANANRRRQATARARAISIASKQRAARENHASQQNS